MNAHQLLVSGAPMKKALFLILCSGFLNTAFAKDSTWKICIGDVVLYEEEVKLVVNVFEHRAEDGRSTDLTLIYGGNVLGGNFDSTENDSGTTILKNDNSTFKGTATVDYSEDTLALDGVLTLFGEPTKLQDTLQCETLSN